MRHRALCVAVLLLAVAVIGIYSSRITAVHGASAHSDVGAATGWNQKAAAEYLDSREVWWQDWPRAQKDHGTICISCHTVVPYAMARPALRAQLSETEMPAPEKTMLESVEKRVSHWSEMVPFYSDAANGPGKTAEAHATEAVLNAVILASYDARQGHLRPITRTAFDEAWALQEETGEKAGAWKWQDFHLAPWESIESGYQGAALLMLEVGKAPGRYAREPEVSRHVERLRQYLRRQYATSASDEPALCSLGVASRARADDPRGAHGLARFAGKTSNNPTADGGSLRSINGSASTIRPSQPTATG